MIYQIDFAQASSGKMVSMTKRRIRWRWGIANEKALSDGKYGVECRGYEHEVTLVWSITSGKRLIIDDGNEVHFSIGRRAEGKFQHSWTGCNNHVFTIVAYASPPLNARQKASFKQFDLMIDGMSFDSFPRIFELGTCRSSSLPHLSASRRLHSGNSVSYRTASPSSYSEHRSDRESVRPSQDDEMQWARKMHALESQRSMNEFHDVQREKASQHLTQQQIVTEDLLSSPTESLLDMEIPSPTSTLSTELTPASQWDTPTDQYCAYNNPSQPPSYEAVWSSIMDAYDTKEQSNPSIGTDNIPAISNLQISTFHDDADYKSNHKDFSSMESPKDVSDIDGVLKNLVNLDDISSNVSHGFSKEKFEKEQREQNRSKTLYQLKSTNTCNSSTSGNHQKEIMKSHQPVVNNPGAVVVYGQPQQQQHPICSNYSYNSSFMSRAF